MTVWLFWDAGDGTQHQAPFGSLEEATAQAASDLGAGRDVLGIRESEDAESKTLRTREEIENG